MPAPACLHLNLTCCLQKPLVLGKAFHHPRSPGAVKDAAEDPQSGHHGGIPVPHGPPSCSGMRGPGGGAGWWLTRRRQEAASPFSEHVNG